MRVLCVGTRFPPEGRGGYERHCAAVVAALRARGHEVRVLTSGSGPEQPGVARTLVRFPVVPRSTSYLAAWSGERHNARALADELERFRPDVVCWWRLGELSLSLVERVRAAGVPAVGVVCDGWMAEAPERDPWTRVRRLAGDAPAVAGGAEWLWVSASLLAGVRALGMPAPSAGLAPPGVDPSRFPARASGTPWRGRLLCAGRLSHAKGVDTAIAAVAQLGRDVSLDVVGDGEPAVVAALRERARRLGVTDRVRFAPAEGREALAARYRDADAVLFCVRWEEPFGLVPLEAMASGVPVLASGTGGSASYLRDGENALLVGRDDPARVAGAVRALAADAGLRARLEAGGRETAAAHDEARASAVVVERLEARAAVRPRAAA